MHRIATHFNQIWGVANIPICCTGIVTYLDSEWYMIKKMIRLICSRSYMYTVLSYHMNYVRMRGNCFRNSLLKPYLMVI